MIIVSISKEIFGVFMVIDKLDSNINKDVSKEKIFLEKDSDQVKEVLKLNNKGEEINFEFIKEKIVQECCIDVDSKVKESGKVSFFEIVLFLGNILDSLDVIVVGILNFGS